MITGPELLAAYRTGRGSVVLRGTATIERAGSSSGGGSSSRSRKSGATAKAKPRGKAAAAAAATAEAAAEKLAQAAETADGGPELIVITELPYSVCKVGFGRG